MIDLLRQTIMERRFAAEAEYADEVARVEAEMLVIYRERLERRAAVRALYRAHGRIGSLCWQW